jgi:hypothetical protein
MARGGIYDQLAGGFARYSVDAEWVVPHFEKMLYDNALLLRVYLHWWRRTGSPLAKRIARETADFLLRDLRTPDGGFASALDADTDGVEGLTYRWTVSQIREVLGDADTPRALAVFGIDEDAADPEGEVLRLVDDPEHPEGQDDREWLASARARLLAARALRPQPGRDDIVVMRDTALAATALAEAGAALGRPEWIEAASVAVDRLTAVHRVAGEWRHSSFADVAGPAPATLADLGCLAAAGLAVYQATGAPGHLAAALAVLDGLPERFAAADGGWFDAMGEGAEGPAIIRPRDPADGAAPSGAAAVTDALVTAFALSGSPSYRDLAADSLAAVTAVILRYPRSGGWHLAAAEALEAGPLQVAIVLPGGAGHDSFAGDPMVAAARRATPGGAVIDVGNPDEPGRPLLADRAVVGGVATAYVCRGFVCGAPVTDPVALLSALR